MTEIRDLIDLSQQLLSAAKCKSNTEELVMLFTAITIDQIKEQLANDNFKKAFWINTYNAFTQVILSQKPGMYQERSFFFKAKQISIAGQKISLDAIEHGFLRRSKTKYSFGYVNKLFPGSFEKLNRVARLDYRIHFALNCGARSCPPVAFYTPEHLEIQLNMATQSYLIEEAEYNQTENTIALPALMNWFRADFGGYNKTVALLHQLEIVTLNKKPKIKYKPYDWNLYLENYK